MKRLLAASAVGISALFAIPAASASAAVPLDATGCSSNVCIYLAGNSGGTALIQGWARNTTFTGYFHLSGKNVGNNHNSNTQTWYGHKGNYWSTTVNNAQSGQYCVTGYSSSGSYEGTACENLS